MTEKIGCVQHDCDECKARLAQPEQEPVQQEKPYAQVLVDWFDEANGFSHGTKAPHKWVLQAEAELRRFLHPTPPLPEQERNFCPRCGKRTADLTTIHTCTPPQENT